MKLKWLQRKKPKLFLLWNPKKDTELEASDISESRDEARSLYKDQVVPQIPSPL